PLRSVEDVGNQKVDAARELALPAVQELARRAVAPLEDLVERIEHGALVAVAAGFRADARQSLRGQLDDLARDVERGTVRRPRLQTDPGDLGVQRVDLAVAPVHEPLV